jgi:uncharacterized membrane protein YbhN (UPF0104 family)
VVAAGVVLYRMLSDLEWNRVGAALLEIEGWRLVTAALLVAGGYATLTAYDYFALRTLGLTDIGYRTAALAGFTSYAIAHNVGAVSVTAAAIRYRVYSAHGLDSFAVARVCVVAGFTFWLGNAAFLGVGGALYPDAVTAVDWLPPPINRTIALGVLVALGLYVLWTWNKRRHLGYRALGIALPKGGAALLQIAIGIVDLGCCAMAMYALAPAGYDGGAARFAVIFVCATLLGFASHTPGGIGVFDTAMLVGLPELDKAALVASLIVFRSLYYVIPLALAIAMLVIREARIARRDRRPRSPAAPAASRGPY